MLNEQEKDNWCSLKPSGMEFDEYVSCDASVSVCEIQSVDQIVQDHLTFEEEEEEEEEKMMKKKENDDDYNNNNNNLLRTK